MGLLKVSKHRTYSALRWKVSISHGEQKLGIKLIFVKWPLLGLHRLRMWANLNPASESQIWGGDFREVEHVSSFFDSVNLKGIFERRGFC